MDTGSLSPVETTIINQLQGDFALCSAPFHVTGQRLGLDAATLRGTIARLLQRKVLTRFGPMYQIERMGGQFVLAALQAPEARFDEVTARINAFDAVAHNYRREHALNMWFVLATPSAAAMQQAISAIEQATGLQVHAFPKLHEYFVGMRFTVGGEQPVGQIAPTLPLCSSASSSAAQNVTPQPPSPTQHALIRATQAGLPLVDEPYQAIASNLGWTPAQVMDGLQTMLHHGLIRRIGVVPNHYAIGYRHNAMAVFDVDDNALPQLGPQVGALSFVTHCYHRPRHFPLWPYNLFAMCHGASRPGVLEQVEQIRTLLGPACRQHTALFSTRMLKKTGLRI